ncbi:hypothetical protein [Lentilitoribacter sp. EG35]|uniref:hypothetical protein n=1 Tax=Lentilitoribacter sp. EG35 TaxID=3234192 RepID=UPI00346014EC
MFGFSKEKKLEVAEAAPLADEQTLVDQKKPSSPDHLKSGQILIRVIEPKDKEKCRELLKAHHASTAYADYAFSDDKFESHAAKIYAYPENMVCLVAERALERDQNKAEPTTDQETEIIGLLWASAGSYALSDELIFATCHIIAVHPVKLGRLSAVKTFMLLIKAVKTWSKTRGADEVLVHVTTGTNLKATDRLLRRSGAKTIGGGYVV